MTGLGSMARMCEERLFPVYTWHAEELFRLRGVADRVIARHGDEPENEKVRAIIRLRERLGQVGRRLEDNFGDVAYLNSRDRELVRKASVWLQEHPEAAQA